MEGTGLPWDDIPVPVFPDPSSHRFRKDRRKSPEFRFPFPDAVSVRISEPGTQNPPRCRELRKEAADWSQVRQGSGWSEDATCWTQPSLQGSWKPRSVLFLQLFRVCRYGVYIIVLSNLSLTKAVKITFEASYCSNGMIFIWGLGDNILQVWVAVNLSLVYCCMLAARRFLHFPFKTPACLRLHLDIHT